MRITHIVTRGDDLGGAQVHVRDLCAGLRAAGHEVTVLAGGRGVFTLQLEQSRIPWRNIRHLRAPIHPARDTAALFEVVSALRDLRPDLVATHTAKAGMLGRAAARILGIPSIFTPHGWSIGDRISRKQGLLFRALETIAAKVTDRIVNVCEYERLLARDCRVARADKLAVVYNGLPDVDEGFLAKPAAQPPRVAMVARMAAPKDHATLLRAAAGLSKDEPWTLELAGGGPREDALREMAENLGIPGRVTFRGFQRDVAGILAGAQVLALSSASEAFPYVILEAMRAGLPVVASKVGGIPEAVVHGETGLLFPAGDAEALRACLSLLLGNPRLRREMGAAGRRRFLNHFTLERMLSGTQRVYDAVLRERWGPLALRPVAPRPYSLQ